MRYFIFITILLTSQVFAQENKDYPWLELLDPGKGYKQSGQKLSRLDMGLNPLEVFTGKEKILLVSVHGSRSEGYEWIYPLQTLDSKNTSTFFFRWDDRQCYDRAAKVLLFELSKITKKYPNIKKIVIIGHSYGAVLVTSLIEDWEHNLVSEIHSIAGPIGSSFSRGSCSFSPPKSIPENLTFYQWRTQHHLDEAFKKLKDDPQNLDLLGSKTIRLPQEYRGNRLGHNWSISWVADELGALN